MAFVPAPSLDIPDLPQDPVFSASKTGRYELW